MKNLIFFFALIGSAAAVGIFAGGGPDKGPTAITGSLSAGENPVWVARVELLNDKNEVVRTTLSDETGQFRFDSLEAGTYTVRVTESAYTAYLSEPLTLAAGEQRKLPVVLVKPATPPVADSPEMEEMYDGITVPVPSKSPKGLAKTRGMPETMSMPEMPSRSEPYLGDEGGPGSDVPTAPGTLTAGEINDFAKWTLWEDLNDGTFDQYQQSWQLYLKHRYSVQVTYENGLPVVDAEVRLVSNKNEVVFLARTDNTGRAELWADMVPEVKDRMARGYKALVTLNGKDYTFRGLNAAPEGFNTLEVPGVCNTSNIMDIAFVVDATGSMGDEINYLKSELLDVIKRAGANDPGLVLRTASVFYRDHGDHYVTRQSDFSSNAEQTLDFIRKQHAAGGGDFPEAVDEGLDAALNRLAWSPEARGRLLFLVLDAPPHQADSVTRRIQQLIYKAAAMGVRIIPVTGSGINKNVEFLMRSMALATNGTYVFLTDHSGVGNKHLEPSTDSYEVEKLNDLMVKIIGRYARTTGCDPTQIQTPADTVQTHHQTGPKDSTQQEEPLTLKCFPVPTDGPIDFLVNKAGGVLYIADANGKLVMRFDMTERNRLKAQLGQLASGTYFVRYEWQGNWISQKIIVLHA